MEESGVQIKYLRKKGKYFHVLKEIVIVQKHHHLTLIIFFYYKI